MKLIFKVLLLLFALLNGINGYSQKINNNTENKMKNNKESVSEMYKNILNEKKLERLPEFIDEKYLSDFRKLNQPLLDAFPDIHFTIREIFQDEEKVVTIYNWTGKHQKEYNKIPATHKNVKVDGISIYELKNGKIISSTAKPDKLSFFLQLGVIPEDFMNKNTANHNAVYFVDEFEIPEKSYKKFKEKLDYNRNFIKTLDGFIKDEIIKNIDNPSKINIITIAVWKDQKSLDNAKELVKAEYERIDFNPAEFTQELNVKMKRGIYSNLE